MHHIVNAGTSVQKKCVHMAAVAHSSAVEAWTGQPESLAGLDDLGGQMARCLDLRGTA